MSIDLQFPSIPQVANSHSVATTARVGDTVEGSDWQSILDELFQIEPEVATPSEEATSVEPLRETSSPVPLSAIAFLASFLSKEALAKSNLADSVVEPNADKNSVDDEITSESESQPTAALSELPASEGELDLSPNLWEQVPTAVPTLVLPPEVRSDFLTVDNPPRVQGPDEYPTGIASRPSLVHVPEMRSDSQIVSAVFSVKTEALGDEASRPDSDPLVALADVGLASRSQRPQSETREQPDDRDGKHTNEPEAITEDDAIKTGDVSEPTGGSAGFSQVGHRQIQESGSRSIGSRSPPVSFATEVDAAMADSGEPTRPSPVNLDLRISHGDLGLPDDSGAGELRLQLRQRGEEIQMRLQGTGEGMASRAQSEWAGLVERLKPQGLEAERTHFTAIQGSRESEVRPLHAIETMHGEGNENTDADGQRRSQERDHRQEQQRNHEERVRRQSELKTRFSRFLNW